MSTRFAFRPDYSAAVANPFHHKREAQEEPETEFEETEEEEAVEQPESRVVQEMRQQVADLERSRVQADQEKLNQYQRLKREACAAGDTERYDDLVKEEGRFFANIANRGAEAQQQTDAAITAKWIERNRWMQNAYLQLCAGCCPALCGQRHHRRKAIAAG